MQAQTPPEIDQCEQQEIRLPLPIVKAGKDYHDKVALLRRMDEILIQSGVEDKLVAYQVEQAAIAAAEKGKKLSGRRRSSVQTHAHQTIRCVIARILSSESFRDFACHLAESSLLQWFCRCSTLSGTKVPAKSTLQRMEESMSVEVLRSLVNDLTTASTQCDAEDRSVLGLAEAVNLSTVWVDSTCAPLNIHHPADWALLRDGVKSIIQTIIVIRSHGIKHRLPDLESFTTKMNALSIQMGMSSRRGRGDKSKTRKAVLRKMKKIVKKVIGHGQRYSERLQSQWADQTDLSEAQARQLWERLDQMIEILPEAVRLAHERIIGGRKVPNDQKILSLFQPHARVYVRGKAGADIEYGLQMVLTESAEGMIVDCQLMDDRVHNDSQLLMPTLERIKDSFGSEVGSEVATGVVTDRGFSSAANSKKLEENGITDWTLPLSPDACAQKLQDETVKALQRRRAQTEARIGIFKAKFLGKRIPAKNLASQHTFVAWSMLAHNLWLLARLDQAAPAEQVAA